MVLDAREHLQFDVRERTHGQRHALAREARDQGRILVAAYAVVDALHVQNIEGLLDVARWSFLARMGDGFEPEGARPLEHGGEFRRRMTSFGRIQTDGREQVLVGKCLLERAHGVRLAQIPQEAQDQPGTRPHGPLRLVERTANTGDDDLDFHAAPTVRLRIEEDLDVHDPLLLRLAQIVARQEVEILRVAQHRRTRIINVEKRL